MTGRRMVYFATLAGVVIAVDAARAVRDSQRRRDANAAEMMMMMNLPGGGDGVDDVDDDDGCYGGRGGEESSRGGGVVAWVARVGAPVFSSPVVVVAAQALCVATVEGKCVGLKPEDGALMWTVDVGSPVYAPLLALPPSSSHARDMDAAGGTVAAQGLSSLGMTEDSSHSQMLVVGTAGGVLMGLEVTSRGSPGVMAWRWMGRGRIRGAPAVVAKEENVEMTGRATLVAAWDSGEIHVVDVPTATATATATIVGTEEKAKGTTGTWTGTWTGGCVVRPVAMGRLPAAVFSSPASVTTTRLTSGAAGGAGHNSSVSSLLVGCRDDFLYNLSVVI